MARLSRRERHLAIAFYAVTSVATLAWWAFLIFYPPSRIPFLGEEFSNRSIWVLLAPDTLSALVMSTWMVWAIAKERPISTILAWIHFGAQGYAWAISLGLAVIDPRAYWGVVAMTFSTGVALAFAIRLQATDVLWGAFRFRFSPTRTPQQHWNATLRYVVAMWAVFLLFIPLGIVLVERWLGWDGNWLGGSWRYPVAAVVFVLAASMGLYGGRVMTHQGEGTPLPSDCPRKLVMSGPYRFIRNPMALGGTVQGVMVGLAYGSPLVVVYALIGGFWWEILVRHTEEAYLEEQFGEEYLAYRKAVPCWRFRLRNALRR